ncbi:MAG: hypothetical protein WAV41_01140 [Microgenomates group bacterium]
MSIHLIAIALHGPNHPPVIEINDDQQPNFSHNSGLPYRRTAVPIFSGDDIVAADKGDIGTVDLRFKNKDGNTVFKPILDLKPGELCSATTTNLPSGHRYTFILQRL